MKLYQKIASSIQAHKNCIEIGNKEWEDNHYVTLMEYSNLLPSGSGFDSGTTIDIEKSTSNKIYLNTSYHYMNHHGYYGDWYEYQVIVTPSLAGVIELRIVGKNTLNDIKYYMQELFYNTLNEEYTE